MVGVRDGKQSMAGARAAAATEILQRGFILEDNAPIATNSRKVRQGGQSMERQDSLPAPSETTPIEAPMQMPSSSEADAVRVVKINLLPADIESSSSVDSFEYPSESVVVPKPSDEGVIMTTCDDPVHGYEKLVGLCQDIQYVQGQLLIPMVLYGKSKCLERQCSTKDKDTCCQKRRQCTFYANDVPGGCPYHRATNPYPYAFCRSIPCTMKDADICCPQLDHGFRFKSLWRRTDKSLSRPPRVEPRRRSRYAKPSIQFNQGDLAWFDMTRIVEVDRDLWAPLINFMDTWGENYGWKTEAWMKIKEKSKSKYEQVRL